MVQKICSSMVFLFLFATIVSASQEVTAPRVQDLPLIDGIGDDVVWQQAKAVIVRDRVADIDITLKAVHNGEKIFILAGFPDATESRKHRTLVWDTEMQAYRNGPEREDVFVVKWSMVSYATALTLHEDVPYQADIWFWKADRTNPVGYADDKMHFYRTMKMSDSKMLTSKKGNIFYLSRKGDDGDAAYSTILYTEYKGERVPKYTNQEPTGSRADIMAKGQWSSGRWTIEFSRLLDTGHDDDIILKEGEKYPFAVSRYEVAGRKPEKDSDQPLYGSGEVGELLFLNLVP
ncbi:MAG: hypothetical protein KQH63_15230 [Desulfobulbaceae bacterium]|nr:hypothetical protein [Desulfobulbaceae bacterium]